MAMKVEKAVKGRWLLVAPEMREVKVTTEREEGGVRWRRSWAELGLSSLEYMWMRRLERKGGTLLERVFRILAWVARPRWREEGGETAEVRRVASSLGVRVFMDSQNLEVKTIATQDFSL